MQWVAYFIWAAVALCVGATIVSFLFYLRRQPATIRDDGDNGVDDIAQVTPFNQQRWQLLLSRTPFTSDDVPQGESARIEWAHELLGVEADWFGGGDVAMYPCLSFHNAVGDSIDFIQQRLRENNKLRLYAVKPTGVVLTETAYEASVVLCFAAPVVYAGKSAWRYWPINVYWEWGYLPEQMQCRQIIYAALHSGCEVVGVELDTADIYFLLESRLIPEPLYSISPEPNLITPNAQWDAIAVANAGEPVPGQIKETLSAADLQHRLESSAT